MLPTPLAVVVETNRPVSCDIRSDEDGSMSEERIQSSQVEEDNVTRAVSALLR